MKLYSIFHLNMMYSSIEEDDREKVIKNCYWKLLKLAEDGFPIGLEATANTLEIINNIDPNWIKVLRNHIKEKKIEFIGSGYAQIIGPLVPAEVNDWNQKIGLEIYKKHLGVVPKIALVNEMAYSSGIVEHYLNNGYKAIIMEWNNPRKYHPEWENEWRYFPQYATGTNGEEVPVIWADSIAFQKFQRYVHGEMELNKYMEYLNQHVSDIPHVFPVYCNDSEIFDFRPGRYKTEAEINNGSEWERIKVLFQSLKSEKRFQLIPPGKVLDFLNYPSAGNKIYLESPEQPIPVKKQEKYNINRWALTGRDDLDINTECYKIYKALNNNWASMDDWKELCYLWSSDFRTHITQKRWDVYKRILYGFSTQWIKNDQKEVKVSYLINRLPYSGNNFRCTQEGRFLTIKNEYILLRLNTKKGLTIDQCYFRNISDKPLFGTLDHGYYDDISYGADFYSGHAVIEPPGKHKITDLQNIIPKLFIDGDKIIMESVSQCNSIAFNKEISINGSAIKISKVINFLKKEIKTIHPIHFTFNPEAWDKGSLFFKTHNGGSHLETFYLKDVDVNHGDILSSLISARHGLGATEGIIIIGDKYKELKFQHDLTKSALIPSIIYKQICEGKYFFRLQYSAQEIDETLRKSDDEIEINIDMNIAIRADNCQN